MTSLLRSLLHRVRVQWAPTTEERILRVAPELARLEPYTMAGLSGLVKLYTLARDVAGRGIAGDFVECGVCNGGSAAAVAVAIRESERRLWLYDSFEGLPEPVEIDGPLARTYVGACRGSEAAVAEALTIAGFPASRCVIRKGWFEQTLLVSPPPRIAFLHLDADWYESVLLALETLYDAVEAGGVIVLDDFAHWEGCRHAFYDFIARRGLQPVLERFGYSQAFWVKGREHNREYVGRWEVPPPEFLWNGRRS